MLYDMPAEPAFEGHTPEIVHASIKYYSEQGLPHQNAVSCALRDARRSWRAENPRGAFPAHLVKKKKPKSAKKNRWVEEI